MLAPVDLRADLFEETLRQRSALRRKLVDGGADVRPELLRGVTKISDLANLAQPRPGVIEERRPKHVSCAPRAHARRCVKPARLVWNRAPRRQRHRRRSLEDRPILSG